MTRMASYLAKLKFLLQGFLLVALICLPQPLRADALPILQKPKDPRYLTESSQERKAFLKSRQELLKKLLQDLKKLKVQKPEDKKFLEETKELLKNLPFLWQKIEIEFEQKEPPVPNFPLLPEGKISLSDFKKLLLFGFQLQHELETLKGKLELEKEELNRIEKALDEIYKDYLILTKGSVKLKAYLKLAELLNLQARWAIAKLELQKTEKYLSIISKEKDKWKNTIQKVFNRIQVSRKEIELIRKELEKEKRELEKLKKKNQKLKENIARELALTELRLIKINEKQKKYKKILYETKIETLKTKLETIKAEENIRNLNIKEKNLWKDLAIYLKKQRKKEIGKIIEQHETEIKNLEEQKNFVEFRINYIQEKIVLAKNNINIYKNLANKVKRKTILTNLIEQEKQLIKSLIALQKILQEKKEKIQIFSFEGKKIIFLWKTKLSIWQRTFHKIEKFYRKSEKTAKAILYYPLWKKGETNFTILSLIKIILVLTLGLIVLKILRRRIEKLLIRHLGMAPGVVNSLSTLSYYVMLCLLALVALSSAGINMSQIALIFGALSVGIGFGLQTIANNFISGIILLTERSIKVGDLVQFEDGTIGVVEKINIRSTVIRTFDALEIIVPNSEFISQRISTWTYGDDWRRILIPFGVAYGSDPEKVKEVAIKAARSVPITLEDPDHPIRVRFLGFGESSLDFELAVWTRQYLVNRAMTGIKSDYYYALYKALKEAGIEIPFPQRDIHLRSIYPEALEKITKVFKGEE